MDSWILNVLLMTGLVIHTSNAGDISRDGESNSGNGIEGNNMVGQVIYTSNAGDISRDGESNSGNGIEENNMVGQVIYTSTAGDTIGNYGEVSSDGETEHRAQTEPFHVEDHPESSDTTSVTNVTTATSMTNLTSVLNVSTTTSMTNFNSVLNVTIATSMTNLTSVLTTSLEATPPKHSPTPNLNPQGKSHTGWPLLVLGIVLLLCTSSLVSTITLACQVWKLHGQFCSVLPAHPPRVNVDMIRVRKATEVMETEIEKMMEEAEKTAEKTLCVEADVQETEAAAVVPTAPPADPSSDCVLNV